MLSEYTSFGVAAESTYGAWPVANKQLLNVEDLRPTRNRAQEEPNVWTASPETFALELLDGSGNLVIPTKLQFKNSLILQERLMGASLGALKSETGTDVSCTSGVLTSPADCDMSVFAVGEMVELSGAGIAPNLPEFYGPIVAKTATTLTLPTGQLSDFSAGGSVTIKTQPLLSGTIEGSIAWVAQLLKGTNQFLRGTGYKLGGINWQWQKPGYVTEEITLEGREYEHASADPSTGAIAVKATSFLSSVEAAKGGVGRIWIADGTAAMPAATSLVISRWGVNWRRQLSQIGGLGTSGPAGIDEGSLGGSMMSARVRFDDAARTQACDLISVNKTLIMAISVRDRQGNRICWVQPAGRPKGDLEFGAKGSTVYQNLEVVSHSSRFDDTSTFYAAGVGIGYQHGIFFAPAAP